jgi:Ca-activated chloride channel family protein
MKFAEPLWLFAGLAACGLLIWAWYRYDARQRASLAAFASSHLHAQLTASFSVARRNLQRMLFVASVALLFVALARPQAGFRWEEVKRKGVEILFAVDTSKSMLTPDVKPDRLTRAKLAIDDFLGHLDGDGVGLVAFAGNAFLQCPITLDYDAFNESLDALDTNTIPRGGTDIASAIREAQAALQNRPGSDKILILLTDGEDLEGSAIDAAKSAAQTGLKIYTIGVGTSNGDLIPLPAESGGGFVKDDFGQYVKSHLDEAGLKAIAEATGGSYAPLGPQGQGLDSIYQSYIAPLTKHDLSSRQQKVYIERFQWPLAASLGLLLASLLIGTRKNVKRSKTNLVPPVPAMPRKRMAQMAATSLIAAFAILPASQAHASLSTAESAYKKGDYTTAQKEYTAAAQKQPDKTVLQFDAGTAAYKAGQYPQAADAFQKALGSQQSADPAQLAAQQDAYYNLGNTLYRAGQKTEKDKADDTIKTWEQSIKSYDAALQLKADDADAKFNRDFVQKKLDELKKQQQQQQQQKQDQKQDQQDQKQQGSGQDNKDQKDQQGQSDQSSNDKNQKPQDSKDQSGKGSNDKNVAQNGKDQQKPDGQPKDQKNQGDQKDQTAQNQNQGQQNQPKDDSQKPDQNSTAQNQDKPDQGSGSKPDQQQNQQANSGSQGQQPQGQQPKDQQGNGSSVAQNSGDQNGQTADQRAPGEMSKQEAKQLLDSLKDEQKQLPGQPLARGGDNNQNDQPLKDW